MESNDAKVFGDVDISWLSEPVPPKHSLVRGTAINSAYNKRAKSSLLPDLIISWELFIVLGL